MQPWKIKLLICYPETTRKIAWLYGSKEISCFSPTKTLVEMIIFVVHKYIYIYIFLNVEFNNFEKLDILPAKYNCFKICLHRFEFEEVAI